MPVDTIPKANQRVATQYMILSFFVILFYFKDDSKL